MSTSSEWAGPVESDLHVYSDNIHYCSTCHKAVRGEGKGIMHHCVFKQQWTYKLCTVNALADPESHAQSVSTELDGRETVFGGHGVHCVVRMSAQPGAPTILRDCGCTRALCGRPSA